jgi:hypothetical protein
MPKSGLHLRDHDNEGEWNPVIAEPNGSLPVTIQDQTTSLVFQSFIIEEDTFELASNTVVGEYTFESLNTHGISVGDVVEFYTDVALGSWWLQAHVLSIAVDTPVVGTDTITIDQSFDISYIATSVIGELMN